MQKEKVDITALVDWQQEKSCAHLQAWANENEPKDTMKFKHGYWDQIVFMRDKFAYEFFREHTKEISVISTHTSKSIKLPVYYVLLDNGMELIMRDNFHGIMISVTCPGIPLEFPQGIFDGSKVHTHHYCEGFKDEWIHGSFDSNNRKFTVEIQDYEHMFLFVFHLHLQLFHENVITEEIIKTITLNNKQTNFLINALESAGHEIYDDPSAYGFEEEDYEEEENDEKLEKDLDVFKKEVVDDVLKQLER